MKKSRLSLCRMVVAAGMLLSGVCGGIFAQGTRTNNLSNQWFAGVGGGARFYFGDHNLRMKPMELLSAGGDVYLGKWWSPVIGTRVGYSVQSVKGATQKGSHSTGEIYNASKFLWKQQFNVGHFYGDFLFNLSNLITAEGESNFSTLSPYAGLGWMTCYNAPRANEMSFCVGFLTAFRLSGTLDLTLDLRGSMVNDRFDGEVGGRKEEGILSVNLGLAKRFGGRAVSRSDASLSETERKLLNEQISAVVNENAQLRNQLSNVSPSPREEAVVEKEVVVEKKIEKKDVAVDVMILFAINSSTLSKDARVQLSFLAKMMNDYPESNYVVMGCADKSTGKADTNARLSQARAAAVKDCLVKEFGISPARLSTVAAGGIENRYYNDPALSRSVIIRPSE